MHTSFLVFIALYYFFKLYLYVDSGLHESCGLCVLLIFECLGPVTVPHTYRPLKCCMNQ